MIAVALALGASLSWGLGDFLGGLSARRLPALVVVALSQLAGLAAVASFVLARGDGPPGWRALLPAALAGMAGALGLAALYRAMAIGAMGVAAPISATAAAIPFAAGLAEGDRPSAAQTAGAALAVLGVVLVSRERAAGARVASGVGLAAASAVAFGLFFVGIDAASDEGAAWAVLAARAASCSLALAVALSVRAAIRPALPSLRVLALIGTLDMGANVLFAAASTRGLVGIVSVLASLYPVVTVALARLVLDERIERHQLGGGAAALAGVGLIAAG